MERPLIKLAQSRPWVFGLGRLRLAWFLNRWLVLSYLLVAPGALYLSLMSDIPAEQWLVLEAFFIPFGVILSVDAFLGRYERQELELLLARRSARDLFLILVMPSVVLLLLSSMAISLALSLGGPLQAAARSTLLLGATHLLLVVSRSRWFGLAAFGLWWLVGFTFMVPWVQTAPPALLLWHPMRLSGGGETNIGLEEAVFVIGTGLFVSAWLAVGRSERWLT